VIIAYVAVGLCAVAYGLASVLQSIGARRVAAGDRIDPRSLAKVAIQLPYMAGLGLDGFGWLLSLVALAQLPLFVVQAVVAGAIGFVVLFSAIIQKVRPTRRQILFIVALFAGLLGLAISGAPDEARSTPASFTWAMWIGAIAIGIAGVLVPRWLKSERAAALLGGLAGLAFGGTALCARTLIAEISVNDLRDPLLWAMAVFGALGFIFFTAALQRGSATISTAWMFTAETVVPAIIGLAVLGDSARNGFAGLAAAAFVVTIVSAVGLTLVSPPID
jgi:drug/metabolite transporter (DMT)-like permease